MVGRIREVGLESTELFSYSYFQQSLLRVSIRKKETYKSAQSKQRARHLLFPFLMHSEVPQPLRPYRRTMDIQHRLISQTCSLLFLLIDYIILIED